VIVYLLVGLIGAILTAVVGILLATLAIVSLLIDLSRVDAALAAASQKIVRLRLQYYRLQEIATCRRLVAGAAVPPVFVDENAWYQLATRTAGEAGEPPPEEED
jgi:hypothetical protein